jgi:hypothetical protein
MQKLFVFLFPAFFCSVGFAGEAKTSAFSEPHKDSQGTQRCCLPTVNDCLADCGAKAGCSNKCLQKYCIRFKLSCFEKPKEEKTLLPLPPSKYVFIKNLKVGVEDGEVKKLQIFLNREGILVSSSGNGGVGNETEYFGEKTKKALIKFQEKYSEEILVPLHLTKGTGIFGQATRDFINSKWGVE